MKGWGRVRRLTKLMLVARGRDPARAERGQTGGQQHGNGRDAQSFHAGLRVKPRRAVSESVVAHTVRKVTTTVRFTSTGKSRDWAACQASCPIPGTSQITSIGNSTPIAMLMETPSNANHCGRDAGATCQNS